MAESYGSLKGLYEAMAASLQTRGASLVFGEENIVAQEYACPMVAMVPVGGPYEKETPAYQKDQDPDRDSGWQLNETVEFWCWAFSDNPQSQPIDHANATENLRAFVLQSLYEQRATGLYFVPISERWSLLDNGVNRYGRAMVITVRADISVLNVPIVPALVEAVDSTIAIDN